MEVERALDKRLFALSGSESALFRIDHRINQRGIRVDRTALASAIKIVMGEQDRYKNRLQEVTRNQVATHNSHAQFKLWLKSRGIIVDSIDKEAVIGLLADKSLPSDVREALTIRQEAAKSSTAKFIAMREGLCSDGRLRSLFQFNGANTGRWAGRRTQVQNLPRPRLEENQINEVFKILENVNHG